MPGNTFSRETGTFNFYESKPTTGFLKTRIMRSATYNSCYFKTPSTRKQYLPLWNVVLHSNTKASVMIALNMPQAMKQDDMISASCTVLDTKHSRFNLSIVDSFEKSTIDTLQRQREMGHDLRDNLVTIDSLFWKHDCVCNTTWPQILSKRARKDNNNNSNNNNNNRYPIRLNTSQIWILRFEFEFENGFYHTLFHSFNCKFNFDNNGLYTGKQCYNYDIDCNLNDNPFEIEFELNVQPWSMLKEFVRTRNNYIETKYRQMVNAFTHGWIAFHFPDTLLADLSMEDVLSCADDGYDLSNGLQLFVAPDLTSEKLWKVKMFRKNVFIGFNKIMTWYEQTRTIISDFMLNNNFHGAIDLINLLFEYISFDNAQFNCNSNSNSNRMNLNKYVQTNHSSGEIKLTKKDKSMHRIYVVKEDRDNKYTQDTHRQACYTHLKKLESERRGLKMYGGIKCDLYNYNPIPRDYTNYNKPYTYELVLDSIFDSLSIHKTSINRIVNCWVPVYRQCYYHDISFVDANGQYQGSRCNGHSDYIIQNFPLLNTLPTWALDYEKREKLKKLYTKWIIDRCEFRDNVLKFKLDIDIRDCVDDVRTFVGKINKMNEKHKQLVKFNQFDIDYTNSLKNYFEATMHCPIKYLYVESHTNWYSMLNEYCYDIITWFDYNQDKSLFCKKNQTFIKRQKSKQIKSKKYFQHNNKDKYTRRKYKCNRRNKDKANQRRKLKQKCKHWMQCKTVYDQTLLAFV